MCRTYCPEGIRELSAKWRRPKIAWQAPKDYPKVKMLDYPITGNIDNIPNGTTRDEKKQKGNIVEKLIIKDLRNQGFEITHEQYEMGLKINKLYVNGRIDGIIKNTKNNKRYLLEIKSQTGRHQTDKLRLLSQLHVYRMGLVKENLNGCIVVYEKDGLYEAKKVCMSGKFIKFLFTKFDYLSENIC